VKLKCFPINNTVDKSQDAIIIVGTSSRLWEYRNSKEIPSQNCVVNGNESRVGSDEVVVVVKLQVITEKRYPIEHTIVEHQSDKIWSEFASADI
jgi:hypothetical protein